MTLSSILRATRNRLWDSELVDKKNWLLATISNTKYCFLRLHNQNEKRNFWLWLIKKYLFNFSFEYSKTYKVPHKTWQFWIHQPLQWLRVYCNKPRVDRNHTESSIFPSTFLKPVNGSKTSILNWVMKLNPFMCFSFFFLKNPWKIFHSIHLQAGIKESYVVEI